MARPKSKLSEILAHASAKATLSTALRSVGWLVATTLAALLGLVALGAALWLVVVGVCFVVAAMAVFCRSYLYFMKTNPDYLRSESYGLSKFAMERGLVGDDVTGVFREGADLEFRVGPTLPAEDESKP